MSSLSVFKKMLEDPVSRKIAFSKLNNRHFIPIDRFVFKAIKILDKKCRGPISYDMFFTLIEKSNTSDRNKEAAKEVLGEIIAEPTILASQLDHYIDIVVEDAKARMLQAGILHASEHLANRRVGKVRSILSKVIRDSDTLSFNGNRLVSARTMLELKPDSPGDRLFTGFKRIDEITAGGKIGEFWLWAAYTGEFKSLALMSIAHHNFVNGVNSLFATFEMDEENVRRRLLCIHAEYLGKTLLYRDVELGNYDKEVYFKVASDFDNNRAYGDIEIWQPPLGTTITDVAREYELLSSRKNIPLVILDYLQLLNPARPRGRSREELDETLFEARRIALECKILLVSGHQTSTDGRKTAEKEGKYTKWSLADTINASRLSSVVCWSLQTDLLLKNKQCKIGLCKSRNSSISGSEHYVVANPETGFLSREPIKETWGSDEEIEIDDV